MEGTLSMYRVRITYRPQLTEDDVDQLMDALILRAPGAGPVISQDLAASTFTIVLAIPGGNVHDALKTAGEIGRDTLHALELDRDDVLAAEVEVVDNGVSIAA